MQPRQNPPGAGRTANVPQSPQGDEYIDYDEAVNEIREEEDEEEEEADAEDLDLEGEEDERDDDTPLSGSNHVRNETKDITV